MSRVMPRDMDGIPKTGTLAVIPERRRVEIAFAAKPCAERLEVRLLSARIDKLTKGLA